MYQSLTEKQPAAVGEKAAAGWCCKNIEDVD